MTNKIHINKYSGVNRIRNDNLERQQTSKQESQSRQTEQHQLKTRQLEGISQTEKTTAT